MGRVLAYIFFVLTSVSLHAQTRYFEDQVWDFGEINFWNNDTAWFTVRNATDKNLIFLPTYYNESVQVIFNNRAAGPGESVQLGIIYYSEVKGKFNEAIPLYINQRGEPVVFRLKGNIKGFNPMAQLRCPIVNGDASDNKPEKVITLEVRDITTDEQLTPDILNVKDRFNKKIELERSGMEYELLVVPGTYKVSAAKKGYDDYLAVITLEPYQWRFVVYMDKSEVIIPPVIVEEDPIDINNTNRNPEDGEDPVVVVTTGDVHLHRADSNDLTHHHGRPDNELSTEAYKLNNVILIVDVSSSMSRGGKLEVLKSSFNSLIDALRPEDLVSVISMNSNAQLIQAPVSAFEKDSIKARVQNMKALGGTNGGAAIKMAYELAHEHFIVGGNNQVIIATDGVFYGGSLTRQQIEVLIAEGNTAGIHFSSVAFGSDPKAMLFLGNMAEKGGGTFVQVTNQAEDEALLLEMIKSQSKRH